MDVPPEPAGHLPEQEANIRADVQNNCDVGRLIFNSNKIRRTNNINNSKRLGMKVAGKRTANREEAAAPADYWPEDDRISPCRVPNNNDTVACDPDLPSVPARRKTGPITTWIFTWLTIRCALTLCDSENLR